MEIFKREIMLIGQENFDRLQAARVLVFGVGGVGGYACEALARSGIGSITLVDHDQVSESNINRQIIALHSTINQDKVDAMEARILDIQPTCRVEKRKLFYLPKTKDQFHFEEYDMILDCIDTITAKLDIICEAKRLGVPIISSMGAGNRLDPTKVKVCDVFDTTYDALAKVMRHELRKRAITHCKVVFSDEQAIVPIAVDTQAPAEKRSLPGSSAFVPATFGLVMASEAVKDILAFKS